MIEKTIHQIWVGEKLPPLHYMDTWKSADFNYILWTEEKLNQLAMVNRDKYEKFMAEKIYYGAADIARVEILCQFGGIYIDADTEKLKDLPAEWFDYDFFGAKVQSGMVSNAVMASEKDSSLINEYRRRIGIATKLKPCWNTIGARMLTDIVDEEYATDPTVLILDTYTFYPIYKNYVDPRADEAYAQHNWGSKTKKLYKNSVENSLKISSIVNESNVEE